MWHPSEAGEVLAVDFGGTKVAVSTGDGTRILYRSFPPGASPYQVFDVAENLSKKLGVNKPSLVSISTPGVITDGYARLAPNVDGWEEVNLAEWGTETFNCPTSIVTNDVEAAGWAELLSGQLQGVSTGLYVNLGTGIGAAVVIEGKVLRGAHGFAGEIGYGRVGEAHSIDWSRVDAPLEQLAGGVGLRRVGQRLPMQEGTEWLNSPSWQPVRDAFDELARHLLTCVLLLDPDRVIFGGGLAAVPAIPQHLAMRLNQASLTRMDVRVSDFGAHASVMGALSVGLRLLDSGKNKTSNV